MNKNIAKMLLPISLSLFATSAFADVSNQNSPLGNLFGALANKMTEISKNRVTGGDTSLSSSLSSSGSIRTLNNNTTSTTSSADTQLMANGMWRDPRTGLVWMRCNVWEDKPWDGKSSNSQCADTNGVEMKVTNAGLTNDWAENMVAASDLHFGGFSDWRIPTVSELLTLQGCQTSFGVKPIRLNVDLSKVDYSKGDGFKPSCGSDQYESPILPVTTTPNLDDSDIGGGLTANLSSAGQPIYWSWNTFSDNQARRSAGGFAVRSDQPNEIFNQNLIIAKQMKQARETKSANFDAEQKAIMSRHNAQEAVNNVNMKKYLTALDAYTVKWRTTVQPGDFTTEGLVIQVSGNLVLVQTNSGNKWFNRNTIYPKTMRK